MESPPNRRRSLLLGAALVGAVLLGLVGAALLLNRGPDAEDPPDRSGPADAPESAGPPGADVEGPLARLRESGGTDAEAIASLGAALPSGPDACAELLERIRPELDLAILSPSPEAGAAAIRLVANAVRRGGDPVRLVVESSAYGALVGRGLASPSAGIRAATAGLLGDVGTDAARARIVPLLGDEDPSVRAAAVRAYGALASEGGGRRLAALLETESEAPVRTEILRAFTRNPSLRGTEVGGAVAKALAGGEAAEKLEALSFVTLRRDRSLVPEVLPLLADPVRDVRAQAVRTLTLLRDPRARPGLEALAAREEDDGVRELAEAALKALR